MGRREPTYRLSICACQHASLDGRRIRLASLAGAQAGRDARAAGDRRILRHGRAVTAAARRTLPALADPPPCLQPHTTWRDWFAAGRRRTNTPAVRRVRARSGVAARGKKDNAASAFFLSGSHTRVRGRLKSTDGTLMTV